MNRFVKCCVCENPFGVGDLFCETVIIGLPFIPPDRRHSRCDAGYRTLLRAVGVVNVWKCNTPRTRPDEPIS